MNGIDKSVWKQINNVLSQFYSIESCILFGSRAKGNYKVGSDIDLCIKGSSFSTIDVLALIEKLDSLNLPYHFDFVIYDSIESIELKEHIDRVGKIVYSRNTST